MKGKQKKIIETADFLCRELTVSVKGSTINFDLIL